MSSSIFAGQIAAWHDFYATVATACATLIGLLFLSLSLNLRLLHSQRNDSLIRQARQSFGHLLYALAISLVFLVPFDAPVGLFIALVSLSVGGLLATLQAILQTRRDGRSVGVQLREVWLSLLSYAVLLGVAIRLLGGDTGSLYALVVVISAMLVRPSRNAWNFLIQAGLAMDQRPRQ
jgi:peptidoglycan/LPS O-acetylase OafA/YrhL